ncbi:MAG: hypothetical protein LBV79_07955, partial [Candidatus Adiutrix sp.]|nr:hypothetical protein [Candidatus Adiutrix sp.]
DAPPARAASMYSCSATFSTEDRAKKYRGRFASPTAVRVGGGGIPVIRKDGCLEGVAAVIDKDLATCLLAEKLHSDLLIISTGVPQVSINFGKPNEEKLGTVKAEKMAQYLAEGHFPPGSMGPKIEAALNFLKNGGKEVIITDPKNLGAAVTGGQGTHIIK